MTSLSTSLVVLEEKTWKSSEVSKAIVAVVMLFAVVLMVMGSIIVNKNMEVTELRKDYYATSLNYQKLQLEYYKLEEDNKALQAKFDSALIPESTLSEATKNHIVTPTVTFVKAAAVTVGNGMIDAKDEVVSWVQ